MFFHTIHTLLTRSRKSRPLEREKCEQTHARATVNASANG
jgi:hypothetical protein